MRSYPLSLASLTLAATLVASQGAASGILQTRFEEIPFRQVDRNANGSIDEREFRTAFRMPGIKFQDIDKDRDGLVSKSEARLAYDAYLDDQGMRTPPPHEMALEEAPSRGFWSLFSPPSEHPRRAIIDRMRERQERRSERRDRAIDIPIAFPEYPWGWDEDWHWGECPYECEDVIPQ